MERIIVAVGSRRPPKLNAVSEALKAWESLLPDDAAFEVVGVDVPSGVGDTPKSRAELMAGARGRAEALQRLARERGEAWRYFVGLEGGLEVVCEDDGIPPWNRGKFCSGTGGAGYFFRAGPS